MIYHLRCRACRKEWTAKVIDDDPETNSIELDEPCCQCGDEGVALSVEYEHEDFF